jgi:cytosine/adenosine deaminase-related metal-dependent hydrolase
VNHLDRETGTIEVGKLADLAVIDRDLFASDTGSIGSGRVLATFVGGRPCSRMPRSAEGGAVPRSARPCGVYRIGRMT